MNGNQVSGTLAIPQSLRTVEHKKFAFRKIVGGQHSFKFKTIGKGYTKRSNAQKKSI